MSNLTPALSQFFAAAGISDPIEQAYILRNPDVAAQVPVLGANTARLHYQNYGQKEGRPWGLTAAAPAAPADPAAEAAKRAPPALPASYGTDAASWDSYLKDARTATEGINRMPGVFSDYSKIPSDPTYANELFYPGTKTATGAGATTASNPLLASTPMASTAMAPMANALLSGGPMAPMGAPNGAPATVTLADGTPMYSQPYQQPAPYSPQWAQGSQTADEWAKRQALLTSMGITPYDE